MDEQGQFTNLDVTFNQDYMCWITQGDIAKRHLEKLGESDRGIILFRKMLPGAGQPGVRRPGADHEHLPRAGGERWS